MSQLDMYQEVGQFSEVLGASSHRQMELLITKAISRIRGAMGAIEQQDIPTKCEGIAKVITIVAYLRSCLVFDAESTVEGDLARRLESVFIHLDTQLVKANIISDIQTLRTDPQSGIAILKECELIMNNIHAWWKQVGELHDTSEA